MKNAKIVLVAEWDGWCAPCAADRPLVLTRTGRQRLRTWLTGAADDSRPLTLTCRLCGTGVDVPLERDDPPVEVTADAPERAVPQVSPSESAAPDAAVTSVDTSVLPAVPVAVPASTELTAGREALARALGALVRQRTATQPHPAAPHVPAMAPAAAAPVVPMQRTPSNGGLTELQLLADGIDLLSTGRS